MQHLYELLLRPFAVELRGARALAVVPDRELMTVPFSALRDSSTGRYVVEDLVVLTEPSASFMLAASRMASSSTAPVSALVVGNPAESRLADTSLADLPAAAAEAERVAALYDRKLLLTGKRPTECQSSAGCCRKTCST